jgi:succinoglycan biosynthesis protein ExoV
MKLLYCKMPRGNFGDDLNDWFWDRVAPGLINDQGPGTLFGIGTLLQDYYGKQLPAEGPVYVLGAGAGSKGALPQITDRWHVYGVRGPLTASYFGLSPDLVCGDPAILVGKFTDLHAPTRKGIGFMPHVWSLDDWDWKATCERFGLIYVDPCADSKETIRQISGLDKLITEAMHGAIVADAMRVPWVAVGISDRFEATKWCDWAGSLGIDLHIRRMHQLRRPDTSISSRLRTAAKEMAMRVGKNVNYVTLPNSSATDIVYSERLLTSIMRDAEPQLSTDANLNGLVSKLENTIAKLASDVRVTGSPVAFA